jgi:hypothetical protein
VFDVVCWHRRDTNRTRVDELLTNLVINSYVNVDHQFKKSWLRVHVQRRDPCIVIDRRHDGGDSVGRIINEYISGNATKSFWHVNVTTTFSGRLEDVLQALQLMTIE